MRTALAFALVLGTAGIAAAQPDDPGLRARIRDRVRLAIEQKLMAELQLDAQTSARLQQTLDKYDAQIADIQRDSGQAHRELKQYLDGGGADANVINRLADRILDDRGRMQSLERDRSREVRTVLTPQQYGKLMIVYPQVTKEIKAELWKAIANKRAGRGQPAQPPPELE